MTTAFAVYCENDGSLNFYNRDTVPSEGSVFEGKTVTEVYTVPASLPVSLIWPWGHTAYSSIRFVDVVTVPSARNLFVSNSTGYNAMLTSVDVANLDLSATNDAYCMFYGRSGIEELDLSSLNTEKIATMDYMFYDCSSLKTIYVGDGWSTDAVTSSELMFGGCTNLAGDIPYDSSVVDATYAKYEGGYLTHKVFVPAEFQKDFLICGETLYGIADKIRVLSGTEDAMTPAEMADALDNISLGVELPELTNPASAEEIAMDKQVIDSDGNIITGMAFTVDGGSTYTRKVGGVEYDNRTGKFYFSSVPVPANTLLKTDSFVEMNTDGYLTDDPDEPHMFGNATVGEVAEGVTFTSEEGLRLTGICEMAYSLADELSTQDDLIAQIASALEGKTAGSGSGGSGGTGNIISYSLSGTLNNGVVYGDLPSGYDKRLFIDKFIGGNLIFTNAGCYYGVFPIMNGDSYFYADQMNSSGGLIKASEAFYIGDQTFNWILDSAATTTLTTYSLTLFFMV